MTVIVTINHKGHKYCWDNLNPEQKKDFVEKLNRQTANALGYCEVKDMQEE